MQEMRYHQRVRLMDTFGGWDLRAGRIWCSGKRNQESLRLNDLVPERWSGKGLQFLPHEFAYYEIGII